MSPQYWFRPATHWHAVTEAAAICLVKAGYGLDFITVTYHPDEQPKEKT